MNRIKTADKASISNTEATSTEIGLKETESNKPLPAIGSVIDNSVVVISESHTMFMKNKKPRQQNILKEWSLALSIFNIKARGLAHCLHWMKLS